jgi:hypothetical protein
MFNFVKNMIAAYGAVERNKQLVRELAAVSVAHSTLTAAAKRVLYTHGMSNRSRRQLVKQDQDWKDLQSVLQAQITSSRSPEKTPV